MPLPPLTMQLALPRERYFALRAEAFRRGQTMQGLLREWIDPLLEKLPAAPGPDAGDTEPDD